MEVKILRGEAPTGSGSGSGYGYGYGYGDGDGDGDGYGYGDGDGAYWLAALANWMKTWTEAQRVRLSELKAAGAKIAFWRSNADGYAMHGGKKNVQTAPGVIQEIKGPLKICSKNALHATVNPPKWEGDRLWCVALIGETQQDDDKFGALKREIIAEVVIGSGDGRSL